MKLPVTRTVVIDQLLPREMALLFADMGAIDQAEFFSEIWRIAQEWPGAGWCMQCLAMVEKADLDAISAMKTLAAHLEPEA